MYIIKIEPNENGFHPIESQSHRTECWLDSYIEIPSELVGKVVATGGYCDLAIEDGVLVGVTPTERPAEPEPNPTTEEILNAMLGV